MKNLKKPIFTLSLLFFFLSTAGLLRGNDDFSKVKISSQKLSKNIYMLSGAGGNMALAIGKKGAFLVDDQFAPLHKKIITAIKKISKKPLQFIINTHWHYDHTGGNELMTQLGGIIVAHENVRRRMSVDNFNKLFNKKTPASPHEALPVITFPDRMTFHLGDEKAYIIHFKKAHTDGDAIIHFKNSNIIHTGDLFFNGSYPFIDLAAGGSMAGVISAITSILKMANNQTKIIPGHGPLASKRDLQIYLEMLRAAELKMQDLMFSKGKSLKQIQSLKPFISLDKKWGQGFIKPEVFIKMLFQLLEKKKKDP